jgi:hypothetical protein
VASKLLLLRVASICLVLAVAGIFGAVWLYLRGA